MKIGTMTVETGKKTKGYIHAAWLADCAEVKIPVMSICGEQEGPVFWLNAGVHGEELSGIFAIHRIMEEIDPKDLKGTIIASPGCNQLGVRGSNKFTPEDQLDMDQQFPGNPNGWLSEQMAYHFFNEVKAVANYCIDMHALGGVNACPYTVYKSLAGVDQSVNDMARDLALNFGAEFNCYVDLRTATGELPGSTTGAFDVQCSLNGIPCVMVEMGAGNRILWENVDRAVRGIKNCLRMVGMLEGEVEHYTNQKIITKRNFPVAHMGGLCIGLIEPGVIVPAGEVVAKIVNYYNETLEEIKFDYDICLIGVLENPPVHSGKVCVAAGQVWEKVN